MESNDSFLDTFVSVVIDTATVAAKILPLVLAVVGDEDAQQDGPTDETSTSVNNLNFIFNKSDGAATAENHSDNDLGLYMSKTEPGLYTSLYKSIGTGEWSDITQDLKDYINGQITVAPTRFELDSSPADVNRPVSRIITAGASFLMFNVGLRISGGFELWARKGDDKVGIGIAPMGAKPTSLSADVSVTDKNGSVISLKGKYSQDSEENDKHNSYYTEDEEDILFWELPHGINTDTYLSAINVQLVVDEETFTNACLATADKVKKGPRR